MDAVITKKEKNAVMIVACIAGLFGALAGGAGLYLKESYLMTERDWDVDMIPGFTQGYFGLMSGFTLFLLGTVGNVLVYSRLFCLVFIYWLICLSCDALCVLDVMMVIPFTKENGIFAWQNKPNCTPPDSFLENITIPANTNLHHYSNDVCKEIEMVAILLITVTTAILTSLLISCCTTILTTVALYRARSIESVQPSSMQLAAFSQEAFQPISFNNTVYQTEGFRQ